MRANKSWCAVILSGTTRALREGLVLLLALALLGTTTLTTLAKDSQAPDPSLVASQVKKFGVGKAVKVRLMSGEKLNGHIQSIGADSFTVKLSKGGDERAIPYSQVVEVKDPGPIFWILVGAALVIAIIVAARH